MFEFTMNIPGVQHEKVGLPSDDAVSTFRHGGALAVVSCDGVSATAHGGKMAQALSEDIAFYMATYGSQMKTLDDEVIRQEILQMIRARQRILEKRFGMAMNELGTTISAAILMQDNTCLAVRLGDGMVIVRDKRTQENKPLLMPDGCAESRQTWCTAHGDEDVLKHMVVARCASVDAVSVTSDGMEGVFYTRSGRIYETYGMLLNELPNQGKAKMVTELSELVYDLATDDASIALAINELPVKRLLMGKSPERYLQQKNKNARRFYQYLALRDEGLSVRDAAKRVGWRKPCVYQKNLRYLEEVGLESCRLRKNIVDKSNKRAHP